MKRRWPLILLAGLLILLSVAVVSTLLATRNIAGAVPGKAPILGLARIDAGFIVGTETGIYVSADGQTWSKPAQLAGMPALVTAAGSNRAAILLGGHLLEATDLSVFTKGPPAPERAAAIAGGPAGSIYVSTGPGHLLVVGAGASSTQGPLSGGPSEVVALAAAPMEGGTIFTGGLESGVWRTLAGGRWERILKTPTRAVLIDAGDSKRILIGTAGGILISTDQGLSWRFTPMRLPVEALAQHGQVYFALGENRILYRSSDAKAWKTTALSP